MTHHAILLATWIGEQKDTANYWHKTAGLLTDLPHITAELFFDGLESSVIFALGWAWAKRAMRKEHARIDAEHGVPPHD